MPILTNALNNKQMKAFLSTPYNPTKFPLGYIVPPLKFNGLRLCSPTQFVILLTPQYVKLHIASH